VKLNTRYNCIIIQTKTLHIIYRVYQFEQQFIGLEEAAQVVAKFTLSIPEVSNQSEWRVLIATETLITLFHTGSLIGNDMH